MEEQSGKRQRRARKVLAVPNAIAEGEESSSLDAGDGQVSGVGATPQTEPVRQGEGWIAFVDRVIALHNSNGWAVRTVFHPRPEQSIITHENGSILVLEGSQRAIIKTGETVEI